MHGLFGTPTSPLELLLSGVPVDVADVSAKSGIDVTELVDVLVAEDICAEVTPALAEGYAGLVSEVR
jgi:hypothetical protein